MLLFRALSTYTKCSSKSTYWRYYTRRWIIRKLKNFFVDFLYLFFEWVLSHRKLCNSWKSFYNIMKRREGRIYKENELTNEYICHRKEWEWMRMNEKKKGKRSSDSCSRLKKGNSQSCEQLSLREFHITKPPMMKRFIYLLYNGIVTLCFLSFWLWIRIRLRISCPILWLWDFLR